MKEYTYKRKTKQRKIHTKNSTHKGKYIKGKMNMEKKYTM